MAATVNRTATNGLRRLFTTNAAPTQPETDFFQDVINAKEEAIRKLQYEITKHRGILSPLRRFPLEILGEIFTLVLDTIQDLDGIPYQVVDISLVCKMWRSAALATPRLWNRLAIRLKGETSCIEKYGCWLRRAGRVPCSIALDPTLERGYCSAGGHIEGYCSLLKTGLPEFLSTSGINIGMLSVRCHSLHCLGLLSERVKSIANPSNRPWDAVRSFEVIPAVDAPWDPEVAPLLPHFPNAITSLNLSFSIAEEDFTDEDIGTMGAVLGKLKEFSTMLTWPLALNKTILGLCTNLQSLTLTIDSETEEELETGSVITLPRLTRLRIEEVEANWPTLQYLHTPVLQELDLEFYEDHFYCYVSDAGFEVAQELEGFVKRSRCDSTLSRIRLAFVKVDNNGFKYLLERLPPIKHLTLDHFIVPSDFFQHAREDKCQLLPRLEVFEWFDVSETIQFEHVCHFFARRFRSKHPVQALKKFRMVYRSRTGNANLLAVLRRLGVDAQVVEQ
ncbi:hypothetical protein NMY22_g9735 [Coprinellus aureogranulatus]|nr:hypothetical protein NMY22_g9735 [Coprinellus aureogranulatus]